MIEVVSIAIKEITAITKMSMKELVLLMSIKNIL